MRRLRLALADALDILLMHGPLEFVRRGLDALFGWTIRGWWP